MPLIGWSGRLSRILFLFLLMRPSIARERPRGLWKREARTDRLIQGIPNLLRILFNEILDILGTITGSIRYIKRGLDYVY